VCVRLLVKLMSDYLNELTYPAELAGLGYSVSNHLAGFQVRVLCRMYHVGWGGGREVLCLCACGAGREGLGGGKGCIAGIPHMTVSGDDATWRACACVEPVRVLRCRVSKQPQLSCVGVMMMPPLCGESQGHSSGSR
jgi:hypothetical protein